MPLPPDAAERRRARDGEPFRGHDYLRLLKPSLWRPGLDAAKRASYQALHAALAQLARVAAPLLPFLVEQVHAVLGGRDSVHLEDWPAPRDDLRDDALVAEMRQLRDVVRIARRVREEAGVKHRQPLRRAYVAGLGAALAANRELLVLDYPRLGKRLRDKVKAVAAAVKRGEVRELPDGRFEAAGKLLAADEVTRRFVAQGAAVAAEGGLVVALDLAVDEALAREGLAREVNRAVQDLRKQARLAYGDRVAIGVAGDSAAVDAMLAEHAAWLGEQGLATIARAKVRDPLGAAALEVGGAMIEVSIARA